MESVSKVAVIGMGKIGTVVATNLVKGNRSVIVADSISNRMDNWARVWFQLCTGLFLSDLSMLSQLSA